MIAKKANRARDAVRRLLVTVFGWNLSDLARKQVGMIGFKNWALTVVAESKCWEGGGGGGRGGGGGEGGGGGGGGGGGEGEGEGEGAGEGGGGGRERAEGDGRSPGASRVNVERGLKGGLHFGQQFGDSGAFPRVVPRVEV